jgi:predicted HAD superfamily phosphohydrolase
MDGIDPIHFSATRNIWSLPARHMLKGKRFLLASDVEGPMVLGDVIMEALVEKMRPDGSPTGIRPSYGHIIYTESYKAFSDFTGESLRKCPTAGFSRNCARPQEGTDTILALPLLLACGVDEAYLQQLASKSTPTPGAGSMVRELERMGGAVIGITTAPENVYKALPPDLMSISDQQLVGTQFPLNHARELLIQSGRLDTELGIVKSFICDCYRIIDDSSKVVTTRGGGIRVLDRNGLNRFRSRFSRYLKHELGVSFGREERPGPPTILARIINACGVIGDRGKAAVAMALYRSIDEPGKSVLVTMGDGLNDAVMLRRARFSIGVNGDKAAQSAKIGVITENMECVIPIFKAILAGEEDIDAIVGYAKAEVGNAAIVHKGGPHADEDLLQAHRIMKKRLRGDATTY